MSMQTLDADPGAADTAGGLHDIVANSRRPATGGVLVVRPLKMTGVHQFLETMHPVLPLESAHRLVQLRIYQPEESRHRRRIHQVGLVLDHHWPCVHASNDDCASASQFSADH